MLIFANFFKRFQFGFLLFSVALSLGCKGTKTPIQQPGSSSSSSGGVVVETLVINEIVTKSEDDQFLNGNDWIELFNSSSEMIQLSDYMLADSGSEAYFLPALELMPGGYVVIAAVDADDASPPALSVPFKLSSDDSVTLYLGGNIIDLLTWSDGDIGTGEAYGRLDGKVVAVTPTPEALNEALLTDQVTGEGAIRLSEVVTKAEDNESYLDGNDWIELFNSGDESVDLSNYSIADSGSDVIPLPIFELGAGEYFVIAAVDSEEPNPPMYSVPFKLGSDDSLLLYLGNNVVDSLNWSDGEAEQGTGFGIVEGEAVTTVPTPGAINQAADTGPAYQPTAESVLKVNEVVARSDDEDYLDGNDWIELYNSGAEALNLSAFALADSAEEKAWLPDVVLGPGEYIVIAAVDADDVNPPMPNVPFKLGQDDVVLLFNSDDLLQALDWMDGEAADGVSYGLFNDTEQVLTPSPGAANQL